MNFQPTKIKLLLLTKLFTVVVYFTVTVGGNENYKKDFGPLPTGVVHLPFNDIQSLENAIDTNTCAVIIETIQGESGVRVANRDFIKKIRELCTIHQACLILDEVQTGNARTGNLYSYQNYDVIPDIITTAKGIGGGFPLSAMLVSNNIGKHFKPGKHGSTFGGNPLACAVGKAVFNIICQESFLEGVRTSSAIIFEELKQINQKYNLFKEIRGKGLLIGAELIKLYGNRGPDIAKMALKNGLLILNAGPGVLRFAPALNITKHDITIGIELLEKTVREFINNCNR